MSRKFVSRTYGRGIWKFVVHFYVTVTKRKPKPKPASILMFDDVAVGLLPLDAEAYAAYVDGHWNNWAFVEAHFPRAHKVSIATSPQNVADILDVEKGDATITQAPAWLKREHSLWKPRKGGPSKPGVYTSESNIAALVETLGAAGIPRSSYLLWSAHYTNEHICGPKTCGAKYAADATQFTDRAESKSLDESICEPWFFA